MASVSTYLNFPGTTAAAFGFYREVFGTEYAVPPMRFSDGPPPAEGQPPLPEADKDLIMHVSLPIVAGHMLMGTDASENMGFKVSMGNNLYINLETDTRAETDKLFAALSAGGQVEAPLADMFWGAYFGSLTDKFGVKWMFNCNAKS